MHASTLTENFNPTIFASGMLALAILREWRVITEPGAVASGCKRSTCSKGFFAARLDQKLNVGSGRYRSRFCNVCCLEGYAEFHTDKSACRG